MTLARERKRCRELVCQSLISETPTFNNKDGKRQDKTCSTCKAMLCATLWKYKNQNASKTTNVIFHLKQDTQNGREILVKTSHWRLVRRDHGRLANPRPVTRIGFATHPRSRLKTSVPECVATRVDVETFITHQLRETVRR